MEDQKPDEQLNAIQPYKLDPKGLPLNPQPSDYPDDPLNFPRWQKWLIMGQIFYLALYSPLNTSLINPAFVLLAKVFNVPVASASYATTLPILAVGWAPLIFTPLSSKFGRRPILLTTNFVAIWLTIGTGLTNSWGVLLALRFLSGVCVCFAFSAGPAIICDVFFLHERAFYMGIYAVAITNGAHIGPIIGGYLIDATNYRWAWYFPTILSSGVFILNLFFLPETLFSRSDDTLFSRKVRTRNQLLWDWSGNTLRDHSLRLRDYVRFLEMLKYPSVSLIVIYYSVAFTLGTVLPAVTVASIFNGLYHWNTGQIGLGLGLPLLTGSLLGEAVTGWFCDWVLYQYAKNHNGLQLPESRLYVGISSALVGPAGLILYGVSVQNKDAWIVPCVGLALTTFGLQVATTVSYAYMSDCYKAQAGESAAVINIFRMTIAFTTGFWALRFGEAIGFGKAWGILAAIWFLSFLPVFLLIFKGEKWRHQLGQPNFHGDI